MSDRTKAVLLVVWAFISWSGYIALYNVYGITVLAVCLTIAGILMVAFTVLNRGFGKFELSPDTSVEEKRRHVAAQLTALLALPLIAVSLIDYLIAMTTDGSLAGLLASWVS